MSERWARRPCGVVEDNLCQAPANGPSSTRGSCYACGQPVCLSCSVLVSWRSYGRRRIGFDCLREWDLEHLVPSPDQRARIA